jgi:hypothetical protein
MPTAGRQRVVVAHLGHEGTAVGCERAHHTDAGGWRAPVNCRAAHAFDLGGGHQAASREIDLAHRRRSNVAGARRRYAGLRRVARRRARGEEVRDSDKGDARVADHDPGYDRPGNRAIGPDAPAAPPSRKRLLDLGVTQAAREPGGVVVGVRTDTIELLCCRAVPTCSRPSAASRPWARRA